MYKGYHKRMIEQLGREQELIANKTFVNCVKSKSGVSQALESDGENDGLWPTSACCRI